MPKKPQSNWSTSRRKPPWRVAMPPGVSGSGSNNASISNRSAGTVLIASTPSRIRRQNASGSSAPGTRQPMPITAIGSRAAFSRAAMRCCAFSNARNARLSGERPGSGAGRCGDGHFLRHSARQPIEQQQFDFGVAHFGDRDESNRRRLLNCAVTTRFS